MLRQYSRFGILISLMLGALSLSAQEELSPAENPQYSIKESLPTLWIVGDSAVKADEPARGWGDDLGMFFDLQKINVVNKAGPHSFQRFLVQDQWKEIEESLKPGDFVMVSYKMFYEPTIDPQKTRDFPSKIKSAENNRKLPPISDGAEEGRRSYGLLLKKITQAARLKKSRVVLCTPVPTLRNPRFDPYLAEKSPVALISPELQALIKNCADTERCAFVDLADIVDYAYKQLGSEKTLGLGFSNGPERFARRMTNSEGSLFVARRVVSGLRSIPTGPFEGFLNDAGRKEPLLLGKMPRRTFTLADGKTLDGVLVSAEGNSAEVMEFSTRKKITFSTTTVSEADQKHIEEWKQNNSTIRLSYQVKRAFNKPANASSNEQQHYYQIEVKNVSKDPTLKMKLYYQYKVDVRSDAGIGDPHKDLEFGSLEIPPLAVADSTIVATHQIYLDDVSTVSRYQQRASDGSSQEVLTTMKRRELLTGIAFDVYSGDRLVDRYRANGFMTDTTLSRTGHTFSGR